MRSFSPGFQKEARPFDARADGDFLRAARDFAMPLPRPANGENHAVAILVRAKERSARLLEERPPVVANARFWPGYSWQA